MYVYCVVICYIINITYSYILSSICHKKSFVYGSDKSGKEGDIWPKFLRHQNYRQENTAIHQLSNRHHLAYGFLSVYRHDMTVRKSSAGSIPASQ